MYTNRPFQASRLEERPQKKQISGFCRQERVSSIGNKASPYGQQQFRFPRIPSQKVDTLNRTAVDETQ